MYHDGCKVYEESRGKVDREVARAAKRQMLIEKIRAWAALHDGVPPRIIDWKKVTGTSWPSYLTVIRAFGSWDAAVLQAGFAPRGRGRPIQL